MRTVALFLQIVFLAGTFSGILFAIPQKAFAADSIYSFTMKTIDGQDKKLSDYAGKAVLIVNTASLCGYTKQYRSLQKLYTMYKNQGFVVLAFPANNFKDQEPDDDEAIKVFCQTNYKITFPLFSKIDVTGSRMHPLYRYLTTSSGFNGPITWNFNKFLISPSGKVVGRYDSSMDPFAAPLVKKLEQILPKK